MTAIDPFSVFPLEICFKIVSQNFSSDQDLVALWTEVRHVSKTWRAVIDDFVRQKHLPTTCINYSLGQLRLGPLKWYDNTARFTFDKLSNQDPNMAIFSDKQDRPALRDIVIRNLQKDATDTSIRHWRYPSHVTQIRHFANDTIIPGLQVDWLTLDLRCDWKGLYTALLYEEKLRLNLARKWASRLPRASHTTSTDVAASQIQGIGAGWASRSNMSFAPSREFVKQETLPYKRSGAWHDNTSREARKRRMMRHTEEAGMGSWVADRKDFAKIQELKDARVALDAVTFADEELDPIYVVGVRSTSTDLPR